jgi:hypothetical protein
MNRKTISTLLAVGLLGGLAACATDSVTDFPETTELLSVVPVGGATGVDPNQPITVEFTHPVGWGMEQYVALHEGDVSGPIVPGTWTWSENRTVLTFAPDEPLRPQTQYTLHVGGGLTDADGNIVSCQQGESWGGQWVTSGMMGGMGSGSGGMMGAGWQHQNGTYGMGFVFTTA